MRIALVHDWLVGQRGGEHVLAALCDLLPGAPIFTLVHQVGSVAPAIEAHPIRTSAIQRLPGAPRRFRQYMPVFPLAVEQWDLTAFDLIISTSHCVAKAAPTRRGQPHLAYIHTPMRYLWDQLPEYVPNLPLRPMWTRAARVAAGPLRWWDKRTAGRPTRLLANSRHVAARIARVWGRTAEVLYPPVDVDYFARAAARERHGFLVVSALVPYKRVDVAVLACTRAGWPLTVVGDGPERARLEAMAGPTVRFVGSQQRAELREAYASAVALLFCGVEDFGIVPVEAMAAGCPVVALARGGALETVGESPCAPYMFAQPEPGELIEALRRLEMARNESALTADNLLAGVRRFDPSRFKAGVIRAIEEVAGEKLVSPL